MSRVLISYDVKVPHQERVRKALLEKNWKTVISDPTGNKCYLPNTTLWKEGISSTDARVEISSIVEVPDLERLICVDLSSWAGITGSSFG